MEKYPKEIEAEHVFQDALSCFKGRKIHNLVITFAYDDDDGDISTACFTHGTYYGNVGLLETAKETIMGSEDDD